jgi:hypothetical protein
MNHFLHVKDHIFSALFFYNFDIQYHLRRDIQRMSSPRRNHLVCRKPGTADILQMALIFDFPALFKPTSASRGHTLRHLMAVVFG